MLDKTITTTKDGEHRVSIFAVHLRLNKTGFRTYTTEFIMKETNKSYICFGKRINKDMLMKIDNITITRHDYLGFFTYCKENQKKDALKMLKQHIVILAIQIKEETDLVYSHIEDEI